MAAHLWHFPVCPILSLTGPLPCYGYSFPFYAFISGVLPTGVRALGGPESLIISSFLNPWNHSTCHTIDAQPIFVKEVVNEGERKEWLRIRKEGREC